MTGRYYKVDGERFPSVTTILSATLANPGLAQWRGHVGNEEADRVMKEAAGYGTDVHALVEAVNRDLRASLPSDALALIAPYVEWFDANVSVVLGAERLCVSRRHKYAGTADGIIVMNGDQAATILDLKTSKSDLSQIEWRLQLAAYALAIEEDGIDADRRIIVRMPRAEPGKLYVLEFDPDELLEDQRCFLSVLRLFRWHEERKPKPKPLGPRIRMGGMT